MRFWSVLVLIVSAVLLYAADAAAQKRVSAIVDPNADAFSDTIDVYDPQTGTITRARERLSIGRERPAVFHLDSGGRALIAGGVNNRFLRNVDIYNPVDGSVTDTGEMLTARSGMASLVMPGGLPLIIGGYNGNYIQTVEQYDPVSERFIQTAGSMLTPRQHAAATLLRDGSALITGGFNGTFLSEAEIYDSGRRMFLLTLGAMTEPRVGHSSTLVSDNMVLLTGGCNNSRMGEMICDTFLASAEIYDASIGTFAMAGEMTVARKDHTATDLGGGRILIVGGMNGAANALASAEIYDPATGVFTPTGNMTTARVNHTATLLPDGRVVIAGGESAAGDILASVEIYNPSNGTFSHVGYMSEARTLHSATILNDGKVLLIAGLKGPKLVFDTNYQILWDNIAGNIYFTPDSQTGFVAYTGSGTVLAFSPQTGEVLSRIVTGGMPVHITPILQEQYLAVVSALDNRIFIIDPTSRRLHATYSFSGAGFGFGSQITLSPDGRTGYISSAETGDVIKFDVANGTETGRLSGLRTPAQITVTRSGETLMVVDAGTNTVRGVSAANMSSKYTFAPQDRYYAAIFSIHNKVALNADETMAIIGSQDLVLGEHSAAFLFNPATGEWISYEDVDGNETGGIYAIGLQPGWTMLLPDEKSWLLLSQNFVSLVPTIDPRSVDEDEITLVEYAIFGDPMGSTNIVLTPDGRYAFFASASTDQILQMNLQTGGIVGAYLVGEDPNVSPDQPIAVALTPDSGVLAAASFATNELTMFVDSHIYRQTRYISQQDRFTGISIVNVSPDEDALVQVIARTNTGWTHSYTNDDEIFNPITFTLEANAQKSIDVHELLGLNTDADNSGYLIIDSNKPVIVGYTAVGQIQSSFLTAHIRSMESLAFFAAEDVAHDMILPEIPESSDATMEFSLVNPWYSLLTYTVTHYGIDGTKLTEQNRTLNSQAREVISALGVTTPIPRSQVVLIGGTSGTQAEATAEVFDGNSPSYYLFLSTQVPRQGHTSVPLVDGKVLVAGGRDGIVIHRTAELYDPAANFFSFTPGSMNVERYRHTATRLLNGMILLAGGQNRSSITRTAELFDFTTGSFSYVRDAEGNRSDMALPRDGHTATRLRDGRVLIAGGLDGMGTTDTAEIYDPRTGLFTLLTETMNSSRAFHTATLLGDGRVLFVGGFNGEYLNSAEVYNPATNRFEPVSDMAEARSNHAATLLSDGTVLITGGRNLETDVNETGGLATAEVFEPIFGWFSETGNNMTSPRSYHTAVNFMDNPGGINNRVLISGGIGLSGFGESEELRTLSTSDIYTPGTRMFTISAVMSSARSEHTALLLDEAISAGYLRITSEMGLLASESYNFERGGTPASISAINMARHEGVKDIYSPRFVLDNERMTRLNVINGNEEAAEITLELRANTGALIASRTHYLAGNAQINGTLPDVFENTAISNTHGWIKVSSTQNQVAGTVTFMSLAGANRYVGSFELSATPPPPLPSEGSSYCFIFPLVAEDATDFATELSFLNSGTDTASLTLQLWNVSGNVRDTVSVQRTLAAGTSLTGTLSGLFGRTLNTGNVRFISNRPIHGIGEIRARSGRFITPVPATRYSCP